jgi:hypothetical protein
MSTFSNYTHPLKTVAVRGSLPPSCPAGAAPALCGIEFLTAEPFQEFLCVGGVPKTINVKPLAVVIKGVASRAQRQVSAEFVYLFVAAALAETRGQHNLMWPAAINAGRR